MAHDISATSARIKEIEDFIECLIEELEDEDATHSITVREQLRLAVAQCITARQMLFII